MAGALEGLIVLDLTSHLSGPTMNGITGLKPSWGRVTRAGVFALAESTDHIGSMARSAADTGAILGAIAGPDPNEPEPATEAASFLHARDRFDTWRLSHKPGGGYDDAVLVIAKPDAPAIEIVRGTTDGYGHSSYTFTPDGSDGNRIDPPVSVPSEP